MWPCNLMRNIFHVINIRRGISPDWQRSIQSWIRNTNCSLAFVWTHMPIWSFFETWSACPPCTEITHSGPLTAHNISSSYLLLPNAPERDLLRYFWTAHGWRMLCTANDITKIWRQTLTLKIHDYLENITDVYFSFADIRLLVHSQSVCWTSTFIGTLVMAYSALDTFMTYVIMDYRLIHLLGVSIFPL